MIALSWVGYTIRWALSFLNVALKTPHKRRPSTPPCTPLRGESHKPLSLKKSGDLDTNRGPIQCQGIVRIPLDSQSSQTYRPRRQELIKVAASIVHPKIGQSEAPEVHDRRICSGHHRLI